MTKKAVLVLGAGKIGSMVTCLLAENDDYSVYVADHNQDALKACAQSINKLQTQHLNAQNKDQLTKFLTLHSIDAIISTLPFYCNHTVVETAVDQKVPYFDLTEDVESARYMQTLSQRCLTPLVPQCGLAPGIISIIANDLMGHFEQLDIVKLRVGALPVNPSNVLKYSLTWSTDGLINEYSKPCMAIEDGQVAMLMPLEGYETIELDGLLYEAFNTSGGVGHLAEAFSGKVKTLNYKTLRYPGHCEKIQFLMHDLKLKERPELLKNILEQAIPKTVRDVVLIYVSVTGKQHGELLEENYVNKIYPREFSKQVWSAIQVSTAAGICAVADLVLEAPSRYLGFIPQERFELKQVLNNRFGRIYC